MNALVQAFVAEIESVPVPPDLEVRLQRLWDAAVDAWPRLRCEPARFAAALARATAATRLAADAIESLHAEDLYLALACLDGDPEALRVLDREILPALDPALRRLRLDDGEIAELRQRVRVFLLVGLTHAPKLREYAGRGSLKGWLSVCAIRLVLRERRRERHIPEDDLKLARLAGAIDGVEDRYIQRVVQGVFSSVLRDAIAALNPRQRLLLAQHYLDGMTLEVMAQLHRGQRAAIGRQLASARAALLKLTRTRLKQRCAIADSECDSVIRHAQSQFDETLGDALRAPA